MGDHASDRTVESITRAALAQDIPSSQWANMIRKQSGLSITDEAPVQLQNDLKDLTFKYLSSEYPPLQIARYIQHALGPCRLLPGPILVHAYFENPNEQIARLLLESFDSIISPPLQPEILHQALKSLLNQFSNNNESNSNKSCILLTSQLVLLIPGDSVQTHPELAEQAQRLLTLYSTRLDTGLKEHLQGFIIPSLLEKSPALDNNLALVDNVTRAEDDESSLTVLGASPDVHLAISYIINEYSTFKDSLNIIRGIFLSRSKDQSRALTEILLAATERMNMEKSHDNTTRQEWTMRSWIFSRFPNLYHASDLDKNTLGGISTFIRVRAKTYAKEKADPLINGNATLINNDNNNNNKSYEESLEFACFANSFLRTGLLTQEELQKIAPSADIAKIQEGNNDHVKNYAFDQASSLSQLDEWFNEFKNSFASQDYVAQLICERIVALQKANDLSSLSEFLRALLKDPIVLDLVLVHVEPVQVLGPVCTFIDNFEMNSDFEDEQAIEMFGGVITFLQVVVHRNQLAVDRKRYLGVESGFCYDWLASWSIAYALEGLSPHLRSLLSNWVSALFGDGISDDLINSTNPRTLLTIAPTLVKQCILARVSGCLDNSSLNSGLSYFGQDILKFSLSSVLKWLIQELLRQDNFNTQYAKTALDILQTIITSDSTPKTTLELVGLDLAQLLQDAKFTSLTSFDASQIQNRIGLGPLSTTSMPISMSMPPKQIDSLAYMHSVIPLMTKSPVPPNQDLHILVLRALELYGSSQTLRCILKSLLESSETSMRDWRFLVALTCHPVHPGSPPVLLITLAQEYIKPVALNTLPAKMVKTLIEVFLQSLKRMSQDDCKIFRRVIEQELDRIENETKTELLRQLQLEEPTQDH